VPFLYLGCAYVYPDKDQVDIFVTIDWMVLFLLCMSVGILFDGLRRIWVTLRSRQQYRRNEKNMAIHLLSFMLFVISRFTETYAEQVMKDDPTK